VGQREAEVLGDELLDVRPLDVGTLLQLDDLEDLIPSLARGRPLVSGSDVRGST